MLDEELRLPRGSDNNFLQKAISTHNSNERFVKSIKIANAFSVSHYAGQVLYKVVSFINTSQVFFFICFSRVRLTDLWIRTRTKCTRI